MSTTQTQNDVGAPTGSVETQIKELEQRIQERRRTIALKKQLVVKRIRNKSVGPVMLLLAATGGVALALHGALELLKLVNISRRSRG